MSNTKSPDSAVSGAGATNRVTSTRPTSAASIRVIAVVGTIILVLDQATKIWAVSALADNRTIDLFWTARFNLTYNFGSAFGLGAGLGRWLGLLILFVIAGVLWYARTVTDRRMLVLLGSITGGAIGNIVDRVVRAEDGFLSGGVVDFIDFQWWPIFNIADMAVVCGAIGLMYLTLREPDLTDPDLTDPDLTDPDLTDPELIDPDRTDPELIDPDADTSSGPDTFVKAATGTNSDTDDGAGSAEGPTAERRDVDSPESEDASSKDVT